MAPLAQMGSGAGRAGTLAEGWSKGLQQHWLTSLHAPGTLTLPALGSETLIPPVSAK